VDVPDPRGGPADFRTIGVRLRLTGPTSWFDASAGSQAVLAALPGYETSEAWAEFEDFALGARAYSDFNLLHLGLVPEPGGLMLAAIACIVCVGCRARMRPVRSAKYCHGYASAEV
jgi:hypothetical protein